MHKRLRDGTATRRINGGTLYPGLIVTDAIIYWTLKFLRFAVHIREVYMLTAPFFASNTMIVAYFFGKELWNSGAGLVTAALTAIWFDEKIIESFDLGIGKNEETPVAKKPAKKGCYKTFHVGVDQDMIAFGVLTYDYVFNFEKKAKKEGNMKHKEK
ncbi:hypothetical protein L1887_06203 [Cichorium endivia]|nr:hypothetical protein L1887_06203 [Cichorium endivia]